MKKKNIDKKVALSIGGLSVLCLGLLFGAWYLSHEPEESFTPAAQEVETLAETWDDKLDSGIPEASIKKESLYTGEISDNTQTVISEDENGSNVDLSGSVTKEEAQETKPTEKPEPIGDTTNKGEVPSYPEEVPVTAQEVQAPAGFVTTEEIKEFDFAYAGEEVAEVSFEFTYEDEPTTFEITKSATSGFFGSKGPCK